MPERLEEIPGFDSVETLEEYLSRPTPEVVDTLAKTPGDIMILGAAGKMGPTLAMLAQRAVTEAELDKRVIAVSRFSSPAVADDLRGMGIQAIPADLMDPAALAQLPEAANILYMVGMKFGSTGREAETWAINAFLPGVVAQRFRRSRFVIFSSGNVYPLTPVVQGGCTEETSPAPIGEYAQSVLGRERIFEYFAREFEIPTLFFRLNYAVELRYGVLVDIALKVASGEPVDVSMGHVNVIWQGDANAMALRSLALADTPPRTLNVTGPEILSVRFLAQEFGRLLGKEAVIVGAEQPDALLSNAQRAHALLGYPRVPVGIAIRWIAHWIQQGGPILGKPTKFQVRNGRF